jgi:putative ABC transport system substrate-binding protein
VRRREFIAALGGAAASWPLSARAQQALPVIGFMHSLSLSYVEQFAVPFREGLKQADFVDGRNVTIVYRSADGHYDRLPALAEELVGQKVAVILAAGGTGPAIAASRATQTIPIVFVAASDPIKAGLVASLNRPGGNVTGVSLLGSALEGKRLELLRQIMASPGPIAILINPKYPDADVERRGLEDAATALKQDLLAVAASTDAEIEAAFAGAAQQGARAMLVAQDALFNSRHEAIVKLAARYALPAIYTQREFVEIGGLASYGPSFADGYRSAGNYVGQILKGARPSDLPVLQPTRFEFVLNLRTAKALQLELSPQLLATADEVIE